MIGLIKLISWRFTDMPTTIAELLVAAYEKIGYLTLTDEDAVSGPKEVYTLGLHARVYYQNKAAHEVSGPVYDMINTIMVNPVTDEVEVSFETASSCCGISACVNTEVNPLQLYSPIPPRLIVKFYKELE
jgi:hypothetical protein